MKLLLKAGLTGLACLAALAIAAPLHAMMIAPQPVPLRVAQAEVVVGGKVTKIEDKTVTIAKAEYQIAVVKVEDPILNAKGIKEIRVGFMAPPAVPNPGGPIIRPGRRGITLVEDEELVLMLSKSGEGDIYFIQGPYGAVKKANNAKYEEEVGEVKKAAKLLADPMASLKSKDADERLQTAAMLVERYRTQKPPYTNPPKQEPIDAAESKLILETLRDADWNPPAPKPGVAVFMRITPQNSFFRLGLTKEDKWEFPVVQPGQPPVNVPELAQKWLKDNADTYRIKKFVADTKDEKKEEKKDK